MKISALPTATTPLSGAELFPIVQSGNTRRVTLAQLAASISSVGTLSSLTVSGNLTVDTDTLFVDAANNRVGVGTASPGMLLQIAARGGFGSDGTFYWGQDLTGNNRGLLSWDTGLVSIRSQSALTFLTNGNNERMRLDASGNLGLGVTPSAWATLVPALQLGGGGAFIAAQTTTPALYTGMNAHFNGTSWVYKVDGTATYVLQFNGAHSWFTAASGLAGNTITFTERVRVDGTTTAGETALLLWDVDNGALERVTVGAADSGGVGYKVLRIPN